MLEITLAVGRGIKRVYSFSKFYSRYNFLCSTDNVTCMSEDDLDTLIRHVVKEYDDGNILVDDTKSWDISGAIFFSTTVVTTIGMKNTWKSQLSIQNHLF